MLDLGAGVGTLMTELQERASRANVFGVDVSEGMIRLARPGNVAVMDAGALGFRDSSFEAVVCAFVLFHLHDPRDAFREAARVLTSEGWFATTTWGLGLGYAALDIWDEELDRHGAEPARGELIHHDPVDSPEKVEALFVSHGFESVSSWTDLFEHEMTPETFVRHRMGHGVSRWRYLSLPEDRRPLFAERVQERLSELGPKDLTQREEVIYAMGRFAR